MMVKRGYIYNIILLAALGAYVLNIVQEGVELAASTTEKKANLRKRQLMEERVSSSSCSSIAAIQRLNLSFVDMHSAHSFSASTHHTYSADPRSD